MSEIGDSNAQRQQNKIRQTGASLKSR